MKIYSIITLRLDAQNSIGHFLIFTFFIDPKASFQLLQRNCFVLVQVTIISKLASTFSGLGILFQEAFKGLHLLLADVMAAVVVQMKEVPLHHTLLQSVARIRLCKSAENRCWMKDSHAMQIPQTHFSCLPAVWHKPLRDHVKYYLLQNTRRRMEKSAWFCIV